MYPSNYNDFSMNTEPFYKSLERFFIVALSGQSPYAASYDACKFVAPYVKKYIFGTHFDVYRFVYPISGYAPTFILDMVVTDNDPNKYRGIFTVPDAYRVPHVISIISRSDDPTDEDMLHRYGSICETIIAMKRCTDRNMYYKTNNLIVEHSNPIAQADIIATDILAIEIMQKCFSYDMNRELVQLFLDETYGVKLITLDDDKEYVLGDTSFFGHIITPDTLHNHPRGSISESTNIIETIRAMSDDIKFRYVYEYVCKFDITRSYEVVGIVEIDDDFIDKYLTDNPNIRVIPSMDDGVVTSQEWR